MKLITEMTENVHYLIEEDSEGKKNYLEREREKLIKEWGIKKYEEKLSSHSIQSESSGCCAPRKR